jgi:hypothetical protein
MISLSFITVSSAGQTLGEWKTFLLLRAGPRAEPRARDPGVEIRQVSHSPNASNHPPPPPRGTGTNSITSVLGPTLVPHGGEAANQILRVATRPASAKVGHGSHQDNTAAR